MRHLPTTCQVCGTADQRVIESYAHLARVTSDSKPFPPGGQLAVCSNCGAISKPITQQFLAEIGQIYRAYDVYYQGGGVEQLVLDHKSNLKIRRSDLLCRELAATGLLSGKRRAIDLGCGNGSFLRSLSKTFASWDLFGLELDGRHRDSMHDIPGFMDLFEGDVDSLRGSFDFISMVHALEHFTTPFDTLVRLRDNLAPDGLLFIEIPNVEDNPYDLLIADHVSHFAPASLEAILLRAGYDIVSFHTDWVNKEHSVLARVASAPSLPGQKAMSKGLADEAIQWLVTTATDAERIARGSATFGIFGTSIATTWLSGVLKDRITFYVDEDESRVGREFFGKPILSPTDVTPGAVIFVAVAPIVAEMLVERLRKISHAATFHGPRYNAAVQTR